MTRAGLSEEEAQGLLDWWTERVGGPRDLALSELLQDVSTIVAARTADLAAQVARVEALVDAHTCERPGECAAGGACLGPIPVAALTAALSPAQPDTEAGA